MGNFRNWELHFLSSPPPLLFLPSWRKCFFFTKKIRSRNLFTLVRYSRSPTLQKLINMVVNWVPLQISVSRGDKINLKFIDESVIAKQLGDIGISCMYVRMATLRHSIFRLKFPLDVSKLNSISHRVIIINMFTDNFYNNSSRIIELVRNYIIFLIFVSQYSKVLCSNVDFTFGFYKIFYSYLFSYVTLFILVLKLRIFIEINKCWYIFFSCILYILQLHFEQIIKPFWAIYLNFGTKFHL